MNLHGLAVAAISLVNPQVPVQVRFSMGNTIGADGFQVPTFSAPVPMRAQIQPLTFRDIQQVAGLNLQGTRRALYLFGEADGLVRVSQKGGDLITFPDGSVYLVAIVLEQWPDWCKVAVTLQNGG